MNDIGYALKDNRDATIYLKSAKSLYVFSNIISCSGGVLIGYPIGYGLSKGYYNRSLVAVGFGLVMISIPISIACNNKLKMAVDTYNSKFRTTGSIDKADLRFGITQNGIGLTLRL